MARKPTEEQIQKMKEAGAEMLAAQRQRRANALLFGKRCVYRLDDWNWCIEDIGGNEKRVEETRLYYPDLASCLHRIMDDSLSDKAKKDLKSVLTAIAEAKTSILEAVRKRRDSDA